MITQSLGQLRQSVGIDTGDNIDNIDNLENKWEIIYISIIYDSTENIDIVNYSFIQHKTHSA